MRNIKRKRFVNYKKTAVANRHEPVNGLYNIIAPKMYDKVDEIDDIVFHSNELLEPSDYNNEEQRYDEWEYAYYKFESKLVREVNEINSTLDTIEVVAEIDEYANTLVLFAIYTDSDNYDADSIEYAEVVMDEIEMVKEFFRQLKQSVLQ